MRGGEPHYSVGRLLGHVGRGHRGQSLRVGKDEGPKRAGYAVGSKTALLRLDSETDWTSEGVHSEKP